jgi:hypothetical protein
VIALASQRKVESISETVVALTQRQSDVQKLKESTGPLTLTLLSVIVPDFPEIFAEFREKRFSLLWRGGRDGFCADDCHHRCDGHVNTLTLILNTKGNIFGGFTPVEWESRKWNKKRESEGNSWKADPSLKSFLFTLKNPHNIPARRFALKAEKAREANVVHGVAAFLSEGN